MKDISQILFHRLVEKEKKFSFFAQKFNLTKTDFDINYKSISRAKAIFSEELIIKAFNLFETKINADKEIFKWNEKNPKKIAKEYCFSSYSNIDETGKSLKSLENFSTFYLDIKINIMPRLNRFYKMTCLGLKTIPKSNKLIVFATIVV